MLFNSYIFLFAYLPITLCVAYLLMTYYQRALIAWLLLVSLAFYAWWSPIYLLLLMSSISFNYGLSKAIISFSNQSGKKSLLIAGILANLALLFYFKYANFFLENIQLLLSTNYTLVNVILPLGISFFSFTQIAYLIDSYRGQLSNPRFLDYSLFVSYFPHLIAGPIIHHQDVIPQFQGFLHKNNPTLKRYFIIGLSIFTIGLFKKVCIADMLAPEVDAIFKLPGRGYQLSMLDSWTGALAYTFQLYFDFSGYSDMAIGLSYMLGIKLPINFHSPYKALNIIDFWRRWHMTLSRFFRDYLYIPLGGSKHGNFRKYLNLFIVMLVVGFWHGAGWTFILWGIYHGSLLILNHGWNAIKKTIPDSIKSWFAIKYISYPLNLLSILGTFFLVVLGWVMFRAESVSAAQNFYAGMFHYHRYYYGSAGLVHLLNYFFFGSFLVLCALIAFFLPNCNQIMHSTGAILGSKTITQQFGTTRLAWSPSLIYGSFLGLLLYFCITTIGNNPSSFLYFNF